MQKCSHYILNPDELWIGKGALKPVPGDPEGRWASAEETTNLPLELQGGLDELSRAGRLRRDHRAIPLILREAPDGRFEPYRDFSEPRRRAMARPEGRVRGGRPVAWFSRRGDPTSLRFARGYAPDFDAGVLEQSELRSNLYGGRILKYRILSAKQRRTDADGKKCRRESVSESAVEANMEKRSGRGDRRNGIGDRRRLTT